MLSSYIKNLSILKKFLFINLLVFIFISSLTIAYLIGIQPNLINKKTSNHIQIINNTIEHIRRLQIQFNEDDIRRFLFSTKFLFQNLDRVIIFDSDFNLIGDTDTLDLDPRSFSQRLEIIEMDILSDDSKSEEKKIGKFKKEDSTSLNDILVNYSKSADFGKPFTFTKESYDQFLLITIKNVNDGEKNIGFLAITEKANDIRAAINERKIFIIRTAIVVALVILIFSFVLNRYFLKPIKILVNYTRSIKEKNKKILNIQTIKNRNDELGVLSNSLDEMTNELHKRINNAENFSTDLVHEIRNPLASLKSASEIISETEDKFQRDKLVNIVSQDVTRIERLITDYSQMLKDELAITKEKMKKLDLKLIANSVVDDFNSIYNSKKGIKIVLKANDSKDYVILGIENRIEQIIANLLDNSISFSEDNQTINVVLIKNKDENIILKVIDEGEGFKEKDTNKIFKRFYSNRPKMFGEHSGLGLNIVKNLVELHNGTILASNNTDQKGAKIEITFPKI
ncbi:MAG: HAMP domain-containing sensor histidine kinase [Candidatus Pelagibacter bacterium]|jgi:two-component system sensor histidine kinase ChvG|nr:HAMP domain-containing sensor histidine kinase [Candidatus Pelagibacter bacterium]